MPQPLCNPNKQQHDMGYKTKVLDFLKKQNKLGLPPYRRPLKEPPEIRKRNGSASQTHIDLRKEMRFKRIKLSK